MKVFLTGSTGFVGRNVKAKLESLGHEVFCYTRNTALIPNLVDDEFPLPDVIIHCAGEITYEHKMFESNVVLTEKLLRFARELKVKKFIHIGSSAEYGKVLLPRHEDTACCPTNVYDATKLAATNLCQGFANSFAMDIVVARPFSLYGPNDTPRKLIPRLYKAFMDRTEIKLHPGSHDWIFIDDFVYGLILLMNADASITRGEIYNFGSEISSSNLQVVGALEQALSGTIKIVSEKSAYHSYDVDNWVANCNKAKAKLGWSPAYDLTKGIKEFVMREWFKADTGGNGQ